MQLIINDKEPKKLTANAAKKELEAAGYKLPLQIAFVSGQRREFYNPEKQAMDVKEPRGKTIPLVGKDANGAMIRVYDQANPDERNANIIRYSPTSKIFIKDSAYEVVDTIHDEILAWFIVFCSQVCEDNKVRDIDRKIPLIRIVNKSAELAEVVRNRKLKRRLENIILVDYQSTKEEQDNLVLLAKSLHIPNVDAISTEDGGYAKLSLMVESQLGDLSVTGKNKVRNVAKIEKLLETIDGDGVVLKAAIQQGIDDKKIALVEEEGMQIWYLCDEDGVPKEIALAEIPTTFDAFEALIEAIQTPKADKLVKKIATLLKAK